MKRKHAMAPRQEKDIYKIKNGIKLTDEVKNKSKCKSKSHGIKSCNCKWTSGTNFLSDKSLTTIY